MRRMQLNKVKVILNFNLSQKEIYKTSNINYINKMRKFYD